MTKLKMFVPIIVLVAVMSAIIGCSAIPGAGGAATSAPAGPTTAAAAPGAPGAPTAAPAAPTVPFAATATAPVVAATDAPPRVAPTVTNTPTADPASLAASAAPICEKAFSGPPPPLQNVGAPESPVLTMMNKEYEGRNWFYSPITAIKYATDARNVRSLLCIVETRKQTDKYPDGAPLFQVTWEARLLKWPEGNVLRVRAGMIGSQVFTTSPKPAGNEFYGSRPDAQVIEFVKEALGQ